MNRLWTALVLTVAALAAPSNAAAEFRRIEIKTLGMD
jgi:hypothetical protein